MVFWKNLFLTCVVAVTFTGCSTLEAPTTTRQRQAVVDASISGLARTVADEVKMGRLNKTDATNAQTVLKNAAMANDMSKGVLKPDGKICSDELTCLRFAQEQIRNLEAQLKQRNK